MFGRQNRKALGGRSPVVQYRALHGEGHSGQLQGGGQGLQ